MPHIGVFLDRDGTIVEEMDFISSPDKLRLIPGSADAIREANAQGYKVIIITNQSGVARGLLSEQRLSEIHNALIAILQSHNAHSDAIYYCPHHPQIGEPPYRMDCDCRKPKIGMLTKAAQGFEIDLTQSFVIGDKMTDMQTGNNSGGTSILVLTGYGKQELDLCRQNNVHVDHVSEDLRAAMEYVQLTVQKQQQPTS